MEKIYCAVIDVLFNGFKFGAVLALMIGPVFFTILQVGVERGFWAGVLVALGVSLSDLMYVVICFYGLSSFVEKPYVKAYMGYGGGTILIAFGAYYLLIKSQPKNFSYPGRVREQNSLMYIGKGFLVNAMSPMVPLFWIGAVSIATIDLGYTSPHLFIVFFSGVLSIVLATDIGKAYLSGRLRELITRRSLMIMNAIVGIALIAFGARLVFVTFQLV